MCPRIYWQKCRQSEKRNFAWAKHIDKSCGTPANTTTDKLDPEMMELLLVEDASFGLTFTSMPEKIIPTPLPETPTVSDENRRKAKNTYRENNYSKNYKRQIKGHF